GAAAGPLHPEAPGHHPWRGMAALSRPARAPLATPRQLRRHLRAPLGRDRPRGRAADLPAMVRGLDRLQRRPARPPADLSALRAAAGAARRAALVAPWPRR